MKTKGGAVAVVLLIITFAGLMVWDLYTPVSADDWAYLTIARDGDEPSFWMCDGDRIGSFGDAVAATVGHFGMINGRLANIFLFFFAPLPRAAAATAGAVMAWLMFVFVILLSRRRDTSLASTAIVSVIFLWAGLPWYDYMQSIAFQSNYIWSSVFVLAVMWLWHRRVGLWWLALAGFLAGWMHEGFAVVLLAWSFGQMLVAGNREDRLRASVLFAVVFAGFVLNLAGGTLGRPAKQTDYFRYDSFGGLLTTMASQMWLLYIAAGIVSVPAAKIPRRARIAWFKIHLPLLLAIVAGAAMPFVIVKFDRVVWPMDLMCIVFVVPPMASLLGRIPLKLSAVLSILFVAIYGWWMIQLCVWEKKISSEQDAAVGELTRRRDAGEPFSPLIYVDYTPDDSIPSWLMGVVRQPLADYWSGPRMAASFTRGYADVVPVPTALRDVPFENWPGIAGINSLRGRWPFLLSASDNLTDCRVEVVAGAPDFNMPLTDRMLVSITEGLRPTQKTITAECWPTTFAAPWGDSLTVLGVRPLPRTFRHRPIMEVNLVR